MKLQNVEMEFVAFDAQDVIATSTPWFKDATIVGTYGLFAEYNAANGNVFKMIDGTTAVVADPDYDDKFISYNAGSTTTVTLLPKSDKTSFSNYKNVESLAAIAAWLAQNEQ